MSNFLSQLHSNSFPVGPSCESRKLLEKETHHKLSTSLVRCTIRILVSYIYVGDFDLYVIYDFCKQFIYRRWIFLSETVSALAKDLILLQSTLV